MSGKLLNSPTKFVVAVFAIFAPLHDQAQSRPVNAADDAPHVFGTIALPLGKTRFDNRWRRVLHSPASPVYLHSLMRTARQLPSTERLRLVNSSLNKSILYRHDTHFSGDHWSSANETLARSTGDCEDYVIAKLQALKALGFPEGDLFMTIGHDGDAGSVHALLIARAAGQYYVLDNRIKELVPHERYRGFYPIITLGSRSRWLHGYERGKMPAAIKSMSIALQSGRDLPIGDSRNSAGPKLAGR